MKFFKDIYNIYLTFLGILISLPILAPIFAAIGWTGPSKVIYFIYSFFCHQFAYRSINIADYQIAWCARDTGIWLGIFLAALLIKFNKIPKVSLIFIIPFIVPMALDGGLQTIFTFLNVNVSGALTDAPLYISNNLSRFMTGAIFGVGVGWWIGWQFKSANETLLSKVDNTKSNSWFSTSKYQKLLISLSMIFIMFVIYIGLVAIWDFTSTKNDPIQPLDFAVKIPYDEDFFARRANGLCPTEDANDVFAVECFF
jgi:uncharacterized membrane protein